jgi:hypothetical protein
MTADPQVTLDRLEDQIAWYDRKSTSAQRWYKGMAVLEAVAAGSVTLAAGAGAPRMVTGGIGLVIVVLELVTRINQFQYHWITYRSTCEALKHEKFLFFAEAGPYSDHTDRMKLLAERVEQLVSTEHARWVKGREVESKQQGG